jgi:hypothetical protein
MNRVVDQLEGADMSPCDRHKFIPNPSNSTVLMSTNLAQFMLLQDGRILFDSVCELRAHAWCMARSGEARDAVM